MKLTPRRTHQREVDRNLSSIYDKLNSLLTATTVTTAGTKTTLTINADLAIGGHVTTEGGDGTGSLGSGSIMWDTAGNLFVKGNITSGSTIIGATLKTSTAPQHVEVRESDNAIAFYGSDGGVSTLVGTIVGTSSPGYWFTHIMDFVAEAIHGIIRFNAPQIILNGWVEAAGDVAIAGALNVTGPSYLSGVTGPLAVTGALSGASITAPNVRRVVYSPTIIQTANDGVMPAEVVFTQIAQSGMKEKLRCYDVKRTGDKYVRMSWIDTAAGSTVPPTVRLDVNGVNTDTATNWGDSNTPRSALYDISGLADGTPLTIKMWMQANYSTLTTFNVSQVVIAVTAA